MEKIAVGSWVGYAGDYWLVNHVECGRAWIGNHMHKPRPVPLILLRPVKIEPKEFNDPCVFE